MSTRVSSRRRETAHELGRGPGRCRVGRHRFATILALGLFGSLVAGTAEATEGGASLYLPGFRGPAAGIVPPPGFYFSNDFMAYSGELSGARRIQIGGAVLADVEVEIRADFLTATWVTPLEVLGGRTAISVSLPAGVPRVSAGVLIEAPRLGRTFAFSQRDASFVLGDPIVTGLVGWDSGRLHWSVGASVNVPAGGYQEGELSNLAFNRWIGDVFVAATWLDPALGLDISGAIGFEINGENPDTDYDSGNAFHADLSISKNLTKEISVGLLAGYYDQVSDDSGRGNRIGPYKGRVVAAGASIGYDFTVAGTPITTRVRVLREVDVENRPQGTIGLFTVAFPLGGQTPPAARVAAKY
ncbi:SphA family protein [Microvirga rosea]|uniref:SphA family protein n=1 Tax=Microvirga rosea TaxID=2715425 RepID=UPI001D09E32A|nr:transporter [Microvirga rosea]MCB8821980.1 transporter [Microvirga rosea]